MNKLLRNSGTQNAQDYNLALVGVLDVGKSALTVKYMTRRFINEYDPHLEDIYTKPENIDGQDVLVKVMDTYDKEGSNPDRYLRWADAFIVVYSITNRQSFESAQCYMEMISQYLQVNNKSAPMILAGNKMDLERYRQVSKGEGAAMADQFESQFHETTAAEEYEHVERVFREAVRQSQREQEQQAPLKPLFISEDKGALTSLLNPSGNATIARTSFRRSKSPSNPFSTKPGKDATPPPRKVGPSSSTFRIPAKLKDIFSKQ
ncbi:PREDICTED: ras-like protein family member 12 [Priapulus caudatus]|uniref:small monomeric GTPase n=1 Tax=Priapulus caudatus TaxID=37621 RepID=A0ABM1EFQ6_PRICU|nr:PREDICTED: ras-like protein family member 12 [Priapulus caudatus]